MSATLAILDARIWTGNRAQPRAEAVAITGDRISAVGSSDEIRSLIAPDTRVIDGQNALVTPGFIDCHLHLLEGGYRLASVKLRDADSPDELVERIRRFAAGVPEGTWILGGDWDEQRWGGELPSRAWIDAVTPGHPVFVNRHDGHMALLNSAALRFGQVERGTPDPEGGRIDRDAEGEPTGILRDNALWLVYSAIPPPSAGRQDTALQSAMDHLAGKGITSVHAVGTWAELAVYRRAREAGNLRTRIYAAVPISTWDRLRDEVASSGRGDDWLRIGGVKGFADGSLGSRTAAFFEDYSDAPGNRGLLVESPDDLHAWSLAADRAGFQLLIHAIGDRAVRMQLDNIAAVAAKNGPRDRRARIEHAQHVAPEDIGRFGQLGIIASMQPYQAIDDGRWAEPCAGRKRLETSWAFRSLLDSGSRVVFGSDWFVAPADPIAAIDAAVTRRTIDGKNPGGWFPAQRIGVEEALRALTVDAAYASFEEAIKGSLQPGMLADLAILDRDLTSIPAAEIVDARVLMTIVGGEVVFESGQR